MRRIKSDKLFTNDTNRWIVSYADFVTLLFAFFVVMYAISSVNMIKYKTLAEGLGEAFNKEEREVRPNAAALTKTHAHFISGNSEKAFNELEKALTDIQGSDMKLHSHKGWIELDIKANAIFKSGSAEINPQALGSIKEIAKIVKGKGYSVALEGYTDNKPIKTDKYPSNWELSASRAAAVARELVSLGINAENVSATGYGEQFPIADNQTVLGRSQNRRVVVIIAKDKNSGRFLNPKMAYKKFRNTQQKTSKANQKPKQLIPVVKEIKTPGGGIKFIRSYEEKKINDVEKPKKAEIKSSNQQ